MTYPLHDIGEIAAAYDAIVFDQWGVLHNGSRPYPYAIESLTTLHDQGHQLAVLSNSGKRAAANLKRINDMGFSTQLLNYVLTSGEALWLDIHDNLISERIFFPIEREKGDAIEWAKGLDIQLKYDLNEVEAILLMGLPDGSAIEDWQDFINNALSLNVPVYCSNPDKASPRKGQSNVISPGALAQAMLLRGANVNFYGKPNPSFFKRAQHALGVERILMVGDSLEHDIYGANLAGWDSVLIQGGLYANKFESGNALKTLEDLCIAQNTPPPQYLLKTLK